jgi:acetyl-CoA C-acetyltransferase
MQEAVIVEALRTPIGRGKMGRGDLSGFHAAHLLGRLQRGLVDKAGLAPGDVEQIFGGCVTQAGEQSNNVARHAWLSVNDGDYATAGTSIDTQCGSGQQANHIVNALVRSGGIDVGIACGIELMSHVGLGANVINGPGYFHPEGYPWDQPDQFNAVERIAKKRGLTREALDAFALRSQSCAARARDASSARSCRSRRRCWATTPRRPASCASSIRIRESGRAPSKASPS